MFFLFFCCLGKLEIINLENVEVCLPVTSLQILGSTAATDGSTLRTSPAEQGGSAGSESGGSGVESITGKLSAFPKFPVLYVYFNLAKGEHNVSGRSSAYGDDTNAPRTTEISSNVATAQGILNKYWYWWHNIICYASLSSSRPVPTTLARQRYTSSDPGRFRVRNWKQH